MKEDENLKHVLADLNVRKFESLTQVFDKNIVNIDLSIKFDKIIEIPFCTYCFLIPTINAKTNLFNEGFVKTCFREETDFVMQMCKKGLKVYLDSNALSIDLPRTISKGGIYTVNKLSRHLGEVYNEFIFYKRNKEYLKKISSLNPNPFLRAIIHLSNKLLTFIKFNV